MQLATTATLGCLLLCFLGGTALAGEVPTPAAPATESQARPLSLPEQLGTPARDEAVAEHVERALDAETDEAKELAAALRFTGGIHAADGLRLLARHRELEVRVAAFECLGALRIRSKRILSLTRRSTRAFHVAERCAAIRALGFLGEGVDMAALLEFATEQKPEIRLAAFAAMRSLSGESVPLSVSRWSYWWKRAEQRYGLRVEQALDALEADPARKDAGAHVAALRSYGWVHRGDVVDAVRDWLRAPETELRAHACILAAHHRFADAWRELDWLLRRGSKKLRPLARSALMILGALPDEKP